ncbi:MAG: ABC transporter permease [Lachnospiraceae bacterium]|nr:ABC transporter permease [Lachnospiraceae bacterium]
MLNLVKTLCKTLLQHIPLLLLLVGLQLFLGEIAANALHPDAPPMRIGLYTEADTDLTTTYVSALREIPNLEMIVVDSLTEKDACFDKGAQGFLVIPKDFDRLLQNEAFEVVSLYLAPGITDASHLRDVLANEIFLMKSELLLQKTLTFLSPNIDIDAVEVLQVAEPNFSLAYNGPLYQKQASITPPAYGIPALFLLLAFLHASAFLIGKDMRHVALHQNKRYRYALILGMIVLSSAWLITVLLYALGMNLLYKIAVPLEVLCALAGLAVLMIAVGGLLCFWGKRHWAAWIFVPMLFLNMTLGGGLWGVGEQPSSFALLPVREVLLAASGKHTALFLWIPAILCYLCILIPVPEKLKRRILSIRNKSGV